MGMQHLGIRLSAFLLFIAIAAAWAGLPQQARAEPDGIPVVEQVPKTNAPAEMPDGVNLVCVNQNNLPVDDCLTVKWGEFRYWFFEQRTHYPYEIYATAYDAAGQYVNHTAFQTDDYSIYRITVDADNQTVILRGKYTDFLELYDITGRELKIPWDSLSALTILKSATELILPPDIVTEGQPVNVTVRVSGNASVPEGTVTLKHGDDILGTANLGLDGTAVIALPSMPPGRYFVTAEYSGDSAHEPSRSETLPLVVSRDTSDGGPRVIYLAKSEGPVVKPDDDMRLHCYSGFGSPVPADCPVIEWDGYRFWVFEAPENEQNLTVAAYDADGELKGHKIYSGDRYLTDIRIGSDRTVSLIGQYFGYYGEIKISFPWDDLMALMGKYATTVSLLVSSPEIQEGNEVTLTANVSAMASSPAGTVVFRNRGVPMHAEPLELNGDGTVSLTVADLPPGRHYITAHYSGDSEHMSGDSDHRTVIVLRSAAEREPRVVYLPDEDHPADLPDGTMAGCVTGTDIGGWVDCPVIEWGDYIFWIYTGDSNSYTLTVAAYDMYDRLIGYQTSVGMRYPSDITVDAAAKKVTIRASENETVIMDWEALAELAKMTWTTLASSEDTAEEGETVTLTASVEGRSGTPGGTVEFIERNGKLDPVGVPLEPDGTATLVLTELEAGEYAFTAFYSGDADNSVSKSGAVELTVTAIPMFTVEFISDGMLLETRTVAKNAKIADPPASEKSGHALEGWYADESFAVRWSFDDDVVTDHLRLHAKWEILSYELRYTAGPGGRIVGDALQTVQHGGDGSPVKAEADEGYHFVRWSDGLTDAVRTETNVTADISVSAEFERSSYQVVFHSNGGSYVPPQMVLYGDHAAKPGDPTREGYAFAGWYRDDGTFSQAWDFAQDTVPVGGVELYAKWVILAPDAPVITAAHAGNGQVHLVWSPAPRAETYVIHVSTSGDDEGTEAGSVSGTVHEFTVTGLTNGVTYYLTVEARNSSGSAHSDSVTSVPFTVPGAPVNVRAEAGNGLAVITFESPADDGGRPILKFVVADQDGNIVAEGTGGEIEVKDLVNGQTYRFTVYAINEAGRGPDSAASNEVTPSAPAIGDDDSDDNPTDPGDGDGDDDDNPTGPGDGDGGDGGTPTDPGDGDGDDGGTPTGPGDGDGDDDNPIDPGDGDGDDDDTPTDPGDGDGGDDNPTDPGDGDGDDDDTPTDPGDGDGGDDNPTGPGDGDGDEDDTPTDPGDGDGGDDNPTDPGDGSGGDDQGGRTPTVGNPADPPSAETEDQAVDSSHTAIVLVNGRPTGIEITASTMDEGRRIATFVLEAEWLDALLEDGLDAVITIQTVQPADTTIGLLNGRMVRDMAQREAVVQFIVDSASYTLPAHFIPIGEIASQFGPEAALEEILIAIEIAAATDEQADGIERALGEQGYMLAAPPVQFTLRAEYGGRAVEAAMFGGYIERTIVIPEGTAPERVTTAVVIETDGTVRHVPTKILNVDGRMVAVIKSLTNSTYALVWNPVRFTDTAGHWAEDAAQELGARMIFQGTDGGKFEPNRAMSRAEFSAVIVRALGLKTTSPENRDLPFSDVREQDWFSEAVRTAYARGLIAGTDSGLFRPADPVTREQAMVIMAKAMAITGLADNVQAASDGRLPEGYRDADLVSAWARNSVALALRAGIVTGRDHAELAPQAVITRAEAVIMVRRLLQKSDLI